MGNMLRAGDSRIDTPSAISYNGATNVLTDNTTYDNELLLPRADEKHAANGFEYYQAIPVSAYNDPFKLSCLGVPRYSSFQFHELLI